MLYADYDSLIIQQISSHEVGSGTHHMRLPYKTKITRTAQKYKIFPSLTCGMTCISHNAVQSILSRANIQRSPVYARLTT